MSGRVVRIDPAAHKVADALLPWFVNGTLDRDEVALVERHLSECKRCRDEVEWLRGLHAACVAGEAAPEASSAFRKLRLRLEAPREHRARVSARGRFPLGGRRWTHWIIGVQLALIAGLGTLWLQEDRAPRYATLGAPVAGSTGALVVMFDPATPEAELRRVLHEAQARVVDGPTRANAYILGVAPERRAQAVEMLRAEPAVTLVEELDASGRR
jgi:anti-sigma factor RsiW